MYAGYPLAADEQKVVVNLYIYKAEYVFRKENFQMNCAVKIWRTVKSCRQHKGKNREMTEKHFVPPNEHTKSQQDLSHQRLAKRC